MRSNSYRTSIVGTPVEWRAPWVRTPTPLSTSVGYETMSDDPFCASELAGKMKRFTILLNYGQLIKQRAK